MFGRKLVDPPQFRLSERDGIGQTPRNFTPNPISAHKIFRGLTKQQSSKLDLDDEEIK
jgi:hypothetical protein